VRYPAHIAFQGEQRGIREEAQLLLEHWATPDGGFVLSDYGDGQGQSALL